MINFYIFLCLFNLLMVLMTCGVNRGYGGGVQHRVTSSQGVTSKRKILLSMILWHSNHLIKLFLRIISGQWLYLFLININKIPGTWIHNKTLVIDSNQNKTMVYDDETMIDGQKIYLNGENKWYPERPAIRWQGDLKKAAGSNGAICARRMSHIGQNSI